MLSFLGFCTKSYNENAKWCKVSIEIHINIFTYDVDKSTLKYDLIQIKEKFSNNGTHRSCIEKHTPWKLLVTNVQVWIWLQYKHNRSHKIFIHITQLIKGTNVVITKTELTGGSSKWGCPFDRLTNARIEEAAIATYVIFSHFAASPVFTQIKSYHNNDQ